MSKITVRIQNTLRPKLTSTCSQANASKATAWNGKIDRYLSLLKQKNTLLNIFEIGGPIGVFVVTPSALPVDVPISEPLFGVSALTKGAIVSQFLGYWYSGRGAEVIERDYLFPPRYVFGTHNAIIKLLAAAGVSEPSSVFHPLPRGRETEEPVPGHDRRQPRRWYVTTNTTQGGTVRLVLMMTAPQSGILVSLKPVDEALRKGRNTQKGEFSERVS